MLFEFGQMICHQAGMHDLQETERGTLSECFRTNAFHRRPAGGQPQAKPPSSESEDNGAKLDPAEDAH